MIKPTEREGTPGPEVPGKKIKGTRSLRNKKKKRKKEKLRDFAEKLKSENCEQETRNSKKRKKEGPKERGGSSSYPRGFVTPTGKIIQTWRNFEGEKNKGLRKESANMPKEREGRDSKGNTVSRRSSDARLQRKVRGKNTANCKAAATLNV